MFTTSNLLLLTWAGLPGLSQEELKITSGLHSMVDDYLTSQASQ